MESLLGIDWRVDLPRFPVGEGRPHGVWAGSETCVNDLPSTPRALELLDWTRQEGLCFSLVIPFFSELHATRVSELAGEVLARGGEECVVCDMAGVAMLSSLGLPFSVGRPFVETDVDPHLLRDPVLRGRYGVCGLNRPMLDLLVSLGCRRVYCQPIAPLPSVLLDHTALEVGVVGPAVYIAQSYLCAWEEGRGLGALSTCGGRCAGKRPVLLEGSRGIVYEAFSNGIYHRVGVEASAFSSEPRVRRLVHWPPPPDPTDGWMWPTRR